MAESTNPGDVVTLGLIDRAVQGDQTAWADLLVRYRDRLSEWSPFAWTADCRVGSMHRMSSRKPCSRPATACRL